MPFEHTHFRTSSHISNLLQDTPNLMVQMWDLKVNVYYAVLLILDAIMTYFCHTERQEDSKL